MAKETKVDYLTEDVEIPSQKYVVLSLLTPHFLKSKEKNDFYGIKIRGSYSSYDEAQARAKHLRSVDPAHNVFVGEVGKWLPFEDNPEKANDAEYAEKKLNNLMKSYLQNQAEAKQMYEARKNELMMNSATKNKEKSNKTSLNESELEVDLSSKKEVVTEENIKENVNNLDKDIDSVKEQLKKELENASSIYTELQDQAQEKFFNKKKHN
jgi:hypothetical protein